MTCLCCKSKLKSLTNTVRAAWSIQKNKEKQDQTEVQKLVENAAEKMHIVHHKLEQVEEHFAKVFPTKCVYMGEDQERNPLDWTFDKNFESTGMDVLDKDRFASVFVAVNSEKGPDFYSWLCEFIDLVIVAIIVKLANHVKYQFKLCIKEGGELDKLAALYFDVFCLFTMFFTVFVSHSLYWIRFTNIPGRFDDFLHLLYGLGLAIIGLYVPIRTRIFKRPWGILCGWIMSLVSLGLLYFLGSLKSHHYKGSVHSSWRVIAATLSIFISLSSILCDSDLTREVVFLVSCLPTLYIELNGVRRSSTSTPSETREISFRFGIYVFILLGESILSLILTRMEFPTSSMDRSGIDMISKHSSEALGIVCFSYFLICCLFYMYFNGHMTESGRHALDNSGVPGSVVWLICHLPLGFFLIFLGFGFKQLVYFDNLEAQGDAKYHSKAMQYTTVQICTCLVCSTCFILAIRTAHVNYYWLTYPSCSIRPLTFLSLLALGVSGIENPVLITLFAALSMFCILSVDLWAVTYEKIDRDEIGKGTVSRMSGSNLAMQNLQSELSTLGESTPQAMQTLQISETIRTLQSEMTLSTKIVTSILEEGDSIANGKFHVTENAIERNDTPRSTMIPDSKLSEEIFESVSRTQTGGDSTLNITFHPCQSSI